MTEPTYGALKRQYEATQRALTMAMTELTEAREENERLRELLRRVEWCDTVRDKQHDPVSGCWFCEQPESVGHADDCELHNALQNTEPCQNNAQMSAEG